MTQNEIDEIFDKLEEVWGDWESIFEVMNENNLKVVGSEIRTSDDSCVCDLYTFDYFGEEIVELFYAAYAYYKKLHSSSNVQSAKSKYMKLS